MASIIPINPALPRQAVTVDLGGTRYRLRVWWAETGWWHLDLQTADGIDIVIGRRIDSGDWPLRGLVDDRQPQGAIFVYDRDGAGVRPGPTELGGADGRCQLLWATAAELLDWGREAYA
jgi:hypothetical protein